MLFISKPYFGFFHRIATVRLGVDTIKNSETDESVQIQKVVKCYHHPDFNNDKKVHDIQLLKVR